MAPDARLTGTTPAKLAGGVLTAQQAPHRPGTAPAPGLRAEVTRGHASPHTAVAKEDRLGARRWLDDRGSCPTLRDETSTSASCPAAAATAALAGPFVIPYHPSEGQGSTFFPISIRVAIAGVMGGSQDPDARVARSRQILV